MHDTRYRKLSLLIVAVAGFLIWWTVAISFDFSSMNRGDLVRMKVIAGISIVVVLAGLLYSLDRLRRHGIRHLIQKNWDLAGEKVGLSESVTRLEESYFSTLQSIATAIDANDTYADGHSLRVAGYASRIGREMGLSPKELKTLEEAALFHDIGKLWVPDYLLFKDFLTEDEKGTVRMHSVLGAELLVSAHAPQTLVSAVLYHHERFDGTGHPAGLKGQAIPIEARILAVANAYDTMTAKCIFRQARPVHEAVEELYAGAGTQFDPEVVEVFLSVLDEIEQEDRPGVYSRSFTSHLFSGVGNC